MLLSNQSEFDSLLLVVIFIGVLIQIISNKIPKDKKIIQKEIRSYLNSNKTNK